MMLVSNLMSRIVAELYQKIRDYNCLITLRRICETYLSRDLNHDLKEYWSRTYYGCLKQIDSLIDVITDYLKSCKTNK